MYDELSPHELAIELLSEIHVVHDEEADEDLLELMVDYLAALPNRIMALQLAFAQDDPETFGRLAHQLKGSSGMFGFHRLSEMLAEMESTVRTRALDERLEAPLAILQEVAQTLRSEQTTTQLD